MNQKAFTISIAVLICFTVITLFYKSQQEKDIPRAHKKYEKPENLTPASTAAEGITLKLNEKVQIEIEDRILELTVTKIEDSRCPIDVDCVMSGYVKLAITANLLDRNELVETTAFELIYPKLETDPMKKLGEKIFSNYEVNIKGLTPTELTEEKVPTSDYEITLQINKK